MSGWIKFLAKQTPPSMPPSPILGAASTTATVKPFRANPMAAVNPAKPAPTITTSYCDAIIHGSKEESPRNTRNTRKKTNKNKNSENHIFARLINVVTFSVYSVVTLLYQSG